MGTKSATNALTNHAYALHVCMNGVQRIDNAAFKSSTLTHHELVNTSGIAMAALAHCHFINDNYSSSR